MTLGQGFDIAASGLSAQRTRLETIASNLANINSTRSPEGGPYRRRVPVFESAPMGQGLSGALSAASNGVRVPEIRTDDAEPLLRFEPGHPDADENGFVPYPNIDPIMETVDLMSATRSYQANITTIKSLRAMSSAALDIVR